MYRLAVLDEGLPGVEGDRGGTAGPVGLALDVNQPNKYKLSIGKKLYCKGPRTFLLNKFFLLQNLCVLL